MWAWTNVWANNRDAGDLRRHLAHYDVTAMVSVSVKHPRANIFRDVIDHFGVKLSRKRHWKPVISEETVMTIFLLPVILLNPKSPLGRTTRKWGCTPISKSCGRTSIVQKSKHDLSELSKDHDDRILSANYGISNKKDFSQIFIRHTP